jgi:cytochrome c oxidase subunit 4
MYYMVFLALVVGTILTVAAAKVDMGPLNNVVMLTIACTKATLVVLFFMHVRWSSRLTWVVAMSGFFWLLILFAPEVGRLAPLAGRRTRSARA